MAVPRKKTSRMKRGSRRSADALVAPTYVEDKESGERRRPHHIDLKSGKYRGRQILAPRASLSTGLRVLFQADCLDDPAAPISTTGTRSHTAARRCCTCRSALPLIVRSAHSLQPHVICPAASRRVIYGAPLIAVSMIIVAQWSFTSGDLIILVTIVPVRRAREGDLSTTPSSLIDHGLSMLVFIVCIVNPGGPMRQATSAFFFRLVGALIDVVAGVTIRHRGPGATWRSAGSTEASCPSCPPSAASSGIHPTYASVGFVLDSSSSLRIVPQARLRHDRGNDAVRFEATCSRGELLELLCIGRELLAHLASSSPLASTLSARLVGVLARLGEFLTCRR